jgi:hypothetical protein
MLFDKLDARALPILLLPMLRWEMLLLLGVPFLASPDVTKANGLGRSCTNAGTGVCVRGGTAT